VRWQVEWADRAQKDLARLDRKLQHRITEAVKRFAKDGLGDVRPLQGSENTYRLRVGDWRVLFFRDKGLLLVLVLRVLPRGGAYQP
jgi:mRNA interferase RelE/StbE